MSTEFYLLLACLVLLVVLLIRQAALTHRQEKDRLRQEHDLSVLGNQLLDELDAQRDESISSLQATNQNLLTTMSQMGQNQSTLLESMQRQVLLSTRNQEEKINALRLENERQLDEMPWTGACPSAWTKSWIPASPRSANGWSPSIKGWVKCTPSPPVSEI